MSKYVKKDIPLLGMVLNPLRILRYKISIFADNISGVDFNKQINVEELDFSTSAGNRYQAVTRRFLRMIKKLDLDGEYTFIDLGCGKGKACYYASRFPFKTIIGVELDRGLCKIAKSNMIKKKIENVQIINFDARQYKFPNDNVVVFMNNPFPAIVMEKVMDNLAKLDKKVIIVYLQPECHEAIIKAGFKMIRYWKNYCIYTKSDI